MLLKEMPKHLHYKMFVVLGQRPDTGTLVCILVSICHKSMGFKLNFFVMTPDLSSAYYTKPFKELHYKIALIFLKYRKVTSIHISDIPLIFIQFQLWNLKNKNQNETLHHMGGFHPQSNCHPDPKTCLLCSLDSGETLARVCVP